jgi:hypothetical protein
LRNLDWPTLVSVLMCLLMASVPVAASPVRPPSQAASGQSYTIITEVTAGQGWIDTVEPATAIPAGTTKHYRIKPARGYMISDVQIDGQSIGPVMYATIPNVNADHTISVSFETFDQTKASDISTKLTDDARILLIGPSESVSAVRGHLYHQVGLAEDLGFAITIDILPTDEYHYLLDAYHSGRYSPDEHNVLVSKIAQGWDYVAPVEQPDIVASYPELVLESVQRIYSRAWFDGGQARLILPTAYSSAGTVDTIAEHTYRIGNSFRVPVLPAGQGWQRMVDDHGGATSWGVVCASMLYAQLFEKRPPETGQSDYDTAADVAWATWQAEKTQTHYTGAYQGVSTPVAWTGGRSYFFGTSTMQRSVGRMDGWIAQYDPAVGDMAFDTATYFADAGVPGSEVQDNFASRTYDYIWVQPKSMGEYNTLNTYVRGQFNQDAYFVNYVRYMDQPAGLNAEASGFWALYEEASAVQDNGDAVNNPNRKSRAPQTHVGWGRVWEERTDIQMMEDDLLHATGPVMSMFAAQAYALFTGRDASAAGTWGYSDPDMVEKSGYARRVGYETIVQLGYLDIHEPYDQSVYDVPVFNQNSAFISEGTVSLEAANDVYHIEKDDTLTIPAPGVLANDMAADRGALRAALTSQPANGSLSLNSDGSFVYTPRGGFEGKDRFTYVASGGNQSDEATVYINVWQYYLQPAPPSSLMVGLRSRTSLMLLWVDNSDNENIFVIERSPDGTDDWVQAGAVVADETMYTDTGLACSTTYHYRVGALNSPSAVMYSDVISATTRDCLYPAAPSDLTVVQTSPISISLSWSDNSDKEAGFAVERSFLSDAGWVQIGTVVSDVTTYDDTGLTCDTAHYYRARAYNVAGYYSPYSNVATEKTAACPAGTPTTPYSLTATLASKTAVTLTWQSAVSVTTRFEVERSLDGYTWGRVGVVTYTVHAVTSETPVSLSYLDTGLARGPIYYYRVRAYTDVGGSGYSNAVQAQSPYNVFLPLTLRAWPLLSTISGRVTTEGDYTGPLIDVTVSDGAGHTAITDYYGCFGGSRCRKSIE